jgi:hypothetical protein
VQLVLAQTGLFNGRGDCNTVPKDLVGSVVSLEEHWAHSAGFNTAVHKPEGEFSLCQTEHSLRFLEGRQLISSDRSLLPHSWLGREPLSVNPSAMEQYQTWRLEPLRQAFGHPPSPGAPSYSFLERSGAVVCELLSQNKFLFTQDVRVVLEKNLQRLQLQNEQLSLRDVADVLSMCCRNVEGAGDLASVILYVSGYAEGFSVRTGSPA